MIWILPISTFTILIWNLYISYIAGLALTAATNVCSESMARDIFSDVLLRLSNSDPFIRKKACLCMISVLAKIPEMVEDMIKTLPTLLADEDHGVLISGRNFLEFSRFFIS